MYKELLPLPDTQQANDFTTISVDVAASLFPFEQVKDPVTQRRSNILISISSESFEFDRTNGNQPIP